MDHAATYWSSASLNTSSRKYRLSDAGVCEIDRATEHPTQFVLHGEEGQAGRPAGLELHEHVDIAMRAEVIT